MKLVKHMWESSTLLKELSWTILVLIPKGRADTQGIGLLRVLWKVVDSIFDTGINMVVIFHDVCMYSVPTEARGRK